MIKLSNIKKSYVINDENTPILNIPKLLLEDKNTYMLIGESGHGKTTLLNILCGLLLPDTGNVCYDDIDITTMGEATRDLFRAENIGYLFQDFHLFSGFSALENVLLPLTLVKGIKRKDSIEKAKSILDKLGLNNRYNISVNKLSGGEKQRVALARALVNSPSLIIADEPSGNLDKAHGAKIMDMLVTQAQDTGATLLVVSHDVSYSKMFDHTLDISKLNEEVAL